MFRDSAIVLILFAITGNNGILQLSRRSMVEWHTRNISSVGYLCESLCSNAKICHCARECLCLLCCYPSVNMCKMCTLSQHHMYMCVYICICRNVVKSVNKDKLLKISVFVAAGLRTTFRQYQKIC